MNSDIVVWVFLICLMAGAGCASSGVELLNEGPSKYLRQGASENNIGDNETDDRNVMIADMPEMKGSIASFERRIKIPQKAKDKKVKGTTVVSFFIEPDGSAHSFEIADTTGLGCDQAVVEALKNTTFIPGSDMNGDKVRFLWQVAVRFDL